MKILLRKIKLLFNKIKWRKLNKHNETSIKNLFPLNIVEVGKSTYGNLNIYFYGNKKEYLKIGNYVSIANGVKFILGGNHEINNFSTFPFKVKFLGCDTEAWTKGTIIVSDDVWIGTDAMILSGVKIGQGAVIAAGSIVVKDVPSYAIVAGNPARIIKYRFSNEIVEKMIQVNFEELNITKENIRVIEKELYEELKFENFKKINQVLSNERKKNG